MDVREAICFFPRKHNPKYWKTTFKRFTWVSDNKCARMFLRNVTCLNEMWFLWQMRLMINVTGLTNATGLIVGLHHTSWLQGYLGGILGQETRTEGTLYHMKIVALSCIGMSGILSMIIYVVFHYCLEKMHKWGEKMWPRYVSVECPVSSALNSVCGSCLALLPATSIFNLCPEKVFFWSHGRGIPMDQPPMLWPTIYRACITGT